MTENLSKYRFDHLDDTAFPLLENVDVYEYENNFDYKRWTDNAKICLCEVSWNNDYSNVVKFKDDNARDKYFENLKGYTVELKTAFNVAPDGSVKVPVPYQVATRYNYLYVDLPIMTSKEEPINYENERRTQRFYYFINDIAKNSPNSTTLIVAVDNWTTFINRVNIPYLMLERGHAPMSEIPVDKYLSNPMANNKYLLAPDYNFAKDDGVVKNSKFIPLNNGTKYILFATTMSYKQLEDIVYPKAVSSTSTPATYSDVDARDGYQYQVNDYKWATGGYDYTGVEIETDTFQSSDGNIPNGYSVVAVPSTDANMLFDRMSTQIPFIYKTIKACYMVDDTMFNKGTEFTICNVTCYRVKKAVDNIIDTIKFSKADFNYDKKYEKITKLYTNPYAEIEVTDNDGTVKTFKVENTGDINVRKNSSIAFPFIKLQVYITGIGGNGYSTYKWKQLNGDSDNKIIYSDDFGKYMFEWDIPTYALYVSGYNDFKADNFYKQEADRFNAIVEYHKSTGMANTQFENSKDSADNTEVMTDNSAKAEYDNACDHADMVYGNSVRSADTGKENAEASADTAKTNTNNSAKTNKDNTDTSADTGEINTQASADTVKTNANNTSKMNKDNTDDMADAQELNAQASADTDKTNANNLAKMNKDNTDDLADMQELNAQASADTDKTNANNLAKMNKDNTDDMADTQEDNAQASANTAKTNKDNEADNAVANNEDDTDRDWHNTIDQVNSQWEQCSAAKDLNNDNQKYDAKLTEIQTDAENEVTSTSGVANAVTNLASGIGGAMGSLGSGNVMGAIGSIVSGVVGSVASGITTSVTTTKHKEIADASIENSKDKVYALNNNMVNTFQAGADCSYSISERNYDISRKIASRTATMMKTNAANDKTTDYANAKRTKDTTQSNAANTKTTQDTNALNTKNTEYANAKRTKDTTKANATRTKNTQDANALNTKNTEYDIAKRTKDTTKANAARTKTTQDENALNTKNMEYANAKRTKDTTKANAARTKTTQDENALNTKNLEYANAKRTRDTSVDNAEAQMETGKSNALRTKDNTNKNAKLNRDVSVSNSWYTRWRTVENAKGTLTQKRISNDYAYKQAAMNAPAQYGSYSGDASLDAFERRGIQIKVRTQSDGNIAQAGDLMLRYGYALNQVWNIDESGLTLMKHYTYWKASNIWINEGEGVNQDAQADIQAAFERGVTVWNNPDDIGKVSIYDNWK